VIALPDRAAFVGPGEQAHYAAWLAKIATDIDTTTAGSACPAATVTAVSSRPVLLNDFPSAVVAQPVSGINEKLRVEGCGRSTLHNIFVYRTNSGVANLSLLPGESLAGPRLMVDATSLAPKVVPEFVGGACANPAVPPVGVWGVASITAQPDAKGMWMERWPLSVCGLDRTLLLTFTPLPDGGTSISVNPGWR